MLDTQNKSSLVRTTRLDRLLPKAFILFGILLLVMIIQVIMGYKIFNMEHEKQEVALDRAVLERERSDWQELKQELPALQSEVSKLTGNKTTLLAEINDLNQRVKEKNEAINQKNEATKQKQELQEAINLMTQKIAGLDVQKKALTSESTSLSNEIASLKNQKSQLADNISSLGKDVSNFEAKKNAISGVIETLENKLSGAEGKQRELSQLESEISNKTSELAVLKKGVEDQKSILANLSGPTSEFSIIAKTFTSLEKRLSELDQSSSKSIQDISSFNMKSSALIDQIGKTKEKIDGRLNDLDAMVTRLNSKNTENVQSQPQIPKADKKKE